MKKIKHFYTRTKSITKVAIQYWKERPKSQLLLFSITFAMLILLAVNILVTRHVDNKIVVINTHKIISDFTNSIAGNPHIKSSQKIALVKHFDVIYPKILSQYASAHHSIVLDEAVILQTPKDITDITSSIEKVLAENSVQYLKTLPMKDNSEKIR